MFIDLKKNRIDGLLNIEKANRIIKLLQKENGNFIAIGRTEKEVEALYDLRTGLLWEATQNDIICYEILDYNIETSSLDIDLWELPEKEILIEFAKTKDCPLRSKRKWRLFGKYNWWTSTYECIVLDKAWVGERCSEGYTLLINQQLKQADIFFNTVIENNWYLSAIKTHEPLEWKLETIDLNEKISALSQSPEVSEIQLENLDYNRLRQPKLEPSWWQDPNKGLWELWGNSEEKLKESGLRSRNPELDLKDQPIAIDFGTSGTVVAYSEQGKHRLLRVGLKDFYSPPKSADYENPTVLEFLDIEAMLAAWHKNAYRPEVLWDQVRCSHEAKAALDSSDGDSKKVSSVLTHLKQWVLRNDDAPQVRITDQLKSFEHELVSAEQTLNPVKGEQLQVRENYPFDPVELYAWFLGMSINWRQRGLFLHYHMTFPVKYTQKIRNRILAAFRRGLLRSLPETLSDQAFADFSVEERHSEPVAYAIAALHTSEIEPTDKGIAYAVFDFGGGTTDFDYGLYRWATEEEEDKDGTEEVFEQFGTGGDPFLGGEHLLANLAFEAFKHNLPTCREHHIVFTQPEDANGFPGSEMLIDRSHIASTNSYRIMSQLRPLWETGQLEDNTGRIRLDLLNREGEEIDCEFILDQERLSDFLSRRILRGVINFFSGLKGAFANNLPEQCYLLLGGNSCRSPFVANIFNVVEELNHSDKDELLLGEQELLEVTLDYSSPLLGNIANALVKSIHSDKDEWLLGEQELLEETLDDSDEEPSHQLKQQIQAGFKHIFPEQMPSWKIIQPLEADKENPESKPTAKTGVAWGLLTLRPGSPIKVINHAVEKNDSGDAPFAWFVGSVRRRQFHPSIKANEAWDEWVELGKPREGVFPLVYTREAAAEGKQPGQAGLKFRDIKLAGFTQGSRLYARIIGSNQIEVCTAKDQSTLHESDNLHEIVLN